MEFWEHPVFSGLVGAFIGAIIGAVLTYVAGSRIEKRRHKRHLKEIFNQELLGPLASELGYILEEIENGMLPHSDEGEAATLELNQLIRKHQFGLIPEELQNNVRNIRSMLKNYETHYKSAKGSLEHTIWAKSKEIGLETQDLTIREFNGNTMVNSFPLTRVVLSGKSIREFSASPNALSNIKHDVIPREQGPIWNPISYQQVLTLYEEVLKTTKTDTNISNQRAAREELQRLIRKTIDTARKEMQIE